MNNGKTRSSLIGVAGLYLLYIAYELFQNRADENTTMSMPVRILFIVLFALAGVAIVIYSVCLWRQSGKEEEKPPRDGGSSLK